MNVDARRARSDGHSVLYSTLVRLSDAHDQSDDLVAGVSIGDDEGVTQTIHVVHEQLPPLPESDVGGDDDDDDDESAEEGGAGGALLRLPGTATEGVSLLSVGACDGIMVENTVVDVASGASVQPDAALGVIHISQPSTYRSKPSEQGPFLCDICPKQFPRASQLRRHKREHEDDKPFRCRRCSATFNVEDNLRLHEATHGVVAAAEQSRVADRRGAGGGLRCPECGKSFSRVAGLKAHIRVHEREESLMCSECGDEFALQSQLDKHMLEHRDDADGSDGPSSGLPHSFSCRQCTTAFPRMNQLREHMKQHHRVRNSLSHRTYKRHVDRTGFQHRCSYCNKKFSKPSQLKRHERIHTGERPFLCNVCQKAFNQKGALQIHMQIHNESKPHKCDFCAREFGQKGNLRAHIERVHKSNGGEEFACTECTCVFRKLGSLNAHIGKVHGSLPDSAPIMASQAGSQPCFVDSMLLLDPMDGSVTGAGGSVVVDPDLMHAQLQQLTADGSLSTDILQQALENSGLNPVNDAGAAVLTAAATGVSRKSILASKDRPTGPIRGSSVIAGTVSRSHQSLAPAALSAASTAATATGSVGTVAVDDSAASTVSSSLPVSSDAAATAAAAAVAAAVAAAAANSTSTGAAGSVSALAQHHLSIATLQDAGVLIRRRHLVHKVNGVRWHQCAYCVKEFKKPSDLVRHVRIHTHEKPFKCTQCFRAFTVKSTLTAHVRTHTGVKSYKCNVCDKLFSTHGSLKIHLRLHTGAKPFNCPKCDRKFRTSGHLKSHISSHARDVMAASTGQSGERLRRLRPSGGPDSSIEIERRLPVADMPPLPEPILITDSGLVQPPPRGMHLFQQYGGGAGGSGGSIEGGDGVGGERPYKCSYCSRGFKKSSHMKQHMRGHTGEKPYKCAQCMRSFVSTGVLKAHLRTHTGLKNYRCSICDSMFTTNGSLKRHMSTHSEQRPFMCPYCQKTFKTAVNCKKHMKTHRAEFVTMTEQSQDASDVANVGGTDGSGVAVGSPSHETHLDVAGIDVHQEQQHQPLSSSQHLRTSDDLSQIQRHQAQHQQQLLLQTQLPQHQSTRSQHTLSSFVLSEADEAAARGDTVHSMTAFAHRSAAGQQLLSDQMLDQAGFGGAGGHSTFALDQHGSAAAATSGSLSSSLGQTLMGSGQATLNQLNFDHAPFGLDLASIANFGTQRSSADPSATDVVLTANISSLLQRGPIDSMQQEASSSSRQNLALLSASDVDDGTAVAEPEGRGNRFHQCSVCLRKFKKANHLTQHLRTHAGFSSASHDVRHEEDATAVLSTATGNPAAEVSGLSSLSCETSLAATAVLAATSAIASLPASVRQRVSEASPNVGRSVASGIRRTTASVGSSSATAAAVAAANAASRRGRASASAEAISVSERVLIESAAEKDRVSEMRGAKERFLELEKMPKHSHKCSNCPKSFKKPSDLMRHLRIHTGEKPFACPVCTRSFTVKSTLDSHMKTHTGSEKTFKCHICDSLFATKGTLKVHMRLHTGAKPFKCPHCDQRFRTSGHRKSHMQSHLKASASGSAGGHNAVDRRLRRAAAGGSGRSVTAAAGSSAAPVATTTTVVGGNVVFGGIDGQTAAQLVSIDPSLLQGTGHHSLVSGGNVLPVSLALSDGQGLTSLEAGLSAHIIPGLDSIQLQLTGALGSPGLQITGLDPSLMTQTVQIDAALLAQLQQHGNISLIATQAMGPGVAATDSDLVQKDAMLDGSSSLQGERASGAVASAVAVDDFNTGDDDHDEDDGSSSVIGDDHGQGTELTCNICSRVCRDVADYALHMDSHSAVDPNTAATSSMLSQGRPTKSKNRKCETCGKMFEKPSQLERHVRIHTGDRPFACTLCSKTFNQKNALETHLKSKHKKERPFKCPYCQQTFSQKGNMKTHVKKTHEISLYSSAATIGLSGAEEDETAAEATDTSDGLGPEHVVGADAMTDDVSNISIGGGGTCEDDDPDDDDDDIEDEDGNSSSGGHSHGGDPAAGNSSSQGAFRDDLLYSAYGSGHDSS